MHQGIEGWEMQTVVQTWTTWSVCTTSQRKQEEASLEALRDERGDLGQVFILLSFLCLFTEVANTFPQVVYTSQFQSIFSVHAEGFLAGFGKVGSSREHRKWDFCW